MKKIIEYSKKYLSELVYGGMDGCITTFAIVGGSVGANLNTNIIIILGFSNLIADGFSMSIGSYLANKSESSSEKNNYISALSTFISFFVMGFIPLVPYIIGAFINISNTFEISCILTIITFFIIGINRYLLMGGNKYKIVLETLLLGISAAFIAYYIGYFIDNLLIK